MPDSTRPPSSDDHETPPTGVTEDEWREVLARRQAKAAQPGHRFRVTKPVIAAATGVAVVAVVGFGASKVMGSDDPTAAGPKRPQTTTSASANPTEKTTNVSNGNGFKPLVVDNDVAADIEPMPVFGGPNQKTEFYDTLNGYFTYDMFEPLLDQTGKADELRGNSFEAADFIDTRTVGVFDMQGNFVRDIYDQKFDKQIELYNGTRYLWANPEHAKELIGQIPFATVEALKSASPDNLADLMNKITGDFDPNHAAYNLYLDELEAGTASDIDKHEYLINVVSEIYTLTQDSSIAEEILPGFRQELNDIYTDFSNDPASLNEYREMYSDSNKLENHLYGR